MITGKIGRCSLIIFYFILIVDDMNGGPGAVKLMLQLLINSCLLGKSEIAGSNPTLTFKFQKNNYFFPAHS